MHIIAIPRLEIGIDGTDLDRLAEFWSRALGYEIGDLDQSGRYLDLIPPDPDKPVLYFQLVPERKFAKNRVHVDLYVADAIETIEKLRKLGATTIGEPRTEIDGGWWQVMADPEGNEFCVCRTE